MVPSLVGLLVLLLVASVSAAAQEPSASVETRIVEIWGLPRRVATGGFEHRGEGQPAILFESGGATPLETWNPVLSTVAGFASVVAYDRSGTGQSAWDGLPPTPERVVARLRELLAVLDISPPYILVGHSWGRALVRYFAGSHPADVAGVLYLDPTDVTQSPEAEIASSNRSASAWQSTRRSMR